MSEVNEWFVHYNVTVMISCIYCKAVMRKNFPAAFIKNTLTPEEFKLLIMISKDED